MLTKLTFHLREQKVVEDLKRYNQHLSKSALRERYQSMSLSPYAFYQRTNHLFWSDFYNDWRLSLLGGVEHTQTWLQGNTHVYNFGAYPNRYGKAAFGMDEFDEAIVGDYQYDLWSLGVSIVLNCGSNNIFTFDEASLAVREMAKSYWKTIVDHVLVSPIDFSSGPKPSKVLKTFLKRVERNDTRKTFFKKWVVNQDGGLKLNDSGNYLERLAKKEKDSFLSVLSDYQRAVWYQHKSLRTYRILDVAHEKQRFDRLEEFDRYFVLIASKETDCRILDIKEQRSPAVCHYMTKKELCRYRQVFPNEGIRHEKAFSAISNHPDPFLGWIEHGGRLYSIREKTPIHQRLSTKSLDTYKSYKSMAKIWGATLAFEHLRGARALFGDKGNVFAHAFVVVAEHRDEFLDMVQETAESYANCVVNDYEVFLSEFASDYR